MNIGYIVFWAIPVFFSVIQIISLYNDTKFRVEVYRSVFYSIFGVYTILKLFEINIILLLYLQIFILYEFLQLITKKRIFHYLGIVLFSYGFYLFMIGQEEYINDIPLFVAFSVSITIAIYKTLKMADSSYFTFIISYLIFFSSYFIINKIFLITLLYLSAINIFLYVKNIYDNIFLEEQIEDSHIDKFLNPINLRKRNVNTISLSINFRDAWGGNVDE